MFSVQQIGKTLGREYEEDYKFNYYLFDEEEASWAEQR